MCVLELQVPYKSVDSRSQTVDDREEKLFNDISTVVEFINDHLGRNMSEIAMKLGWSIGKTQNILNKAEEIGSVTSEVVLVKGRANRRFYIIPWYNKLDWKNMDDNDAKEELITKIIQEQSDAHKRGFVLDITDEYLLTRIQEHFKKKYSSEK